MAKFGQLALGNGIWNGQRIVSEAWLTASMTPLTNTAWTDSAQWDWQVDGYGYQWWTGFYDFNGVIYPTYVAWGYGGQWVVAIPESDTTRR